ncbi:MAG TPA: recombinase family protein, partial [Ktedonobacteraceae bacterium]|nr:recombinase family protein [Ktedonobacteraceae bacterium]
MQRKLIYKAISQEEIRNYAFQLPPIDLTRDTALYIRQSERKADKKNGESRKMQLSLKEFAMKLRGQTTMAHIRVYDEGAGKSAGLLIAERPKLNALWQDLRSGEIGQVIVAREDRLFRDEHGDQSGAFSRLARELDIWLFVPSFQPSGELDEFGAIVYYDFKNDDHLKAYKQKMAAAAEYRTGHVKYMNAAKRSKSDRGAYDGRGLPPGLVVDRRVPKELRKPEIYAPWQQVMEWVFKKGEELSYNANALLREIYVLPFLFPEPTEEEKRRYIFNNRMTACPGGYKPASSTVIKGWFTNVMLIGWWPLWGKDESNGIVPVLKDNHPAVIDRETFERAYQYHVGQTLEGENLAVLNSRRSIQIRRDQPLPEALFHGKLTCPNTEGVHTKSNNGCPIYVATRNKKTGHSYQAFAIPAAEFDLLVTDRLRQLIEADITIATKVKKYLEEVLAQQAKDSISIDDQLAEIKRKLSVARRRLGILNRELSGTEEDDALVVSLTKSVNSLIRQQNQLCNKKNSDIKIHGTKEVEKIYNVLMYFDKNWPGMTLDAKQRMMDALITQIDVDVLTPHWFTVRIRWLDVVTPRLDKALVWRVQPAMTSRSFTEEEKKILQEIWPTAPSWSSVLKYIPRRTPSALLVCASRMGILKDTTPGRPRTIADFPSHACWDDLKVDEDAHLALSLIQEAIQKCKEENRGMYAMWVVPASLMDLHTWLTEQYPSNVDHSFDGSICIQSGV